MRAYTEASRAKGAETRLYHTLWNALHVQDRAPTLTELLHDASQSLTCGTFRKTKNAGYATLKLLHVKLAAGGLTLVCGCPLRMDCRSTRKELRRGT